MASEKCLEWLRPENLIRITAWARDGLSETQIGKNIGVSVITIYNWKKAHPEIMEALRRGKEIPDIEVENALFKRAKGYDYIETKIEKSEKYGEKTTTTTKHVAGDVDAQKFWLKNRRPDKWKDKLAVQDDQEIEDTNKVEQDVFYNDPEVKKRIASEKD